MFHRNNWHTHNITITLQSNFQYAVVPYVVMCNKTHYCGLKHIFTTIIKINVVEFYYKALTAKQPPLLCKFHLIFGPPRVHPWSDHFLDRERESNAHTRNISLTRRSIIGLVENYFLRK